MTLLINPYEACSFKPNHRQSKTILTFSKFLNICHVKQNGLRITFNSNLHSRVTLKKNKKIIIIINAYNWSISHEHEKILQLLIANHGFKQMNLHHTSRVKYRGPYVQGSKRTCSCVDKMISNSYFLCSVCSVLFCHRDATLKANVFVTSFQIDPF